MVSVVAASREGRRVTKAPQSTQKALVEDGQFDRGAWSGVSGPPE
jgi:hypothetical protein